MSGHIAIMLVFMRPGHDAVNKLLLCYTQRPDHLTPADVRRGVTDQEEKKQFQ